MRKLSNEELHFRELKNNFNLLRQNLLRAWDENTAVVRKAAVHRFNAALWVANRPISLLNQWAVELSRAAGKKVEEKKEQEELARAKERMDGEGPAIPVVLGSQGKPVESAEIPPLKKSA